MARAKQRTARGVILCGILVITVCLAPAKSFAAESSPAAPVHVAILAGEGDRAVAEPAVAQVEAALSAVKDIALLERAEVRKILVEQKLSAAGLEQPETAARVGQLLGVEAFVFLDRVPKTDPQLSRVQVMEAKTGITLAAGAVEERVLGAEPSETLDIVRRGMAKLRVPLEARHYVALLDLRNEEPGRSLDDLAEALGMFLLTDLSQAPEIVTLNRENLERLTQERNLTALETQIKTASTYLDGGMHRQGEDQIVIRVSLRSLAGGKARDITLQMLRADLPALRQALAKAVAEALGAGTGAVAAADPRSEAALFARCTGDMIARGDYAAAVRAGEAVYALDPANPGSAYYAWMAYKCSLGEFAKLDDAGKRKALRAVLRATALACEKVRAVAAQSEKEGIAYRLPDDLDGMRFVPDMLLPPGDLTDLQNDLFELERKLRDFELDYYRKKYSSLQMAAQYWEVWNGECQRIRLQDAGRDDLIIRRIRDVIEAFVNSPGPLPDAWTFYSFGPLWSVPQEMQAFQYGPRGKDVKAREVYKALWLEYQRHTDPFVRMIACHALICMGEECQENARRLIAIFLKEIPAGHPYRTDATDQIIFPDMVRWAFSFLDAAAKDDARRSILAPWIEQRDGLRLLLWRSLVDQSLRRLEDLNRLEEADAFAAQVLDIVSPCDYRHRKQNFQPEADEFIVRLREKRREYAVKFGLSAPPEDVWERFDIRSVALPVKGAIWASVLDGERLICLTVGYNSTDLAYTLRFSSHNLSDGALQHEAEPLIVPCPEWLQTPNSGIAFSGPEWRQAPVSGIAFSGKRVYVGTPLGLLEYLPGGRARLIGEADGLAGTVIGSVAYYDGKLYLGYGTADERGKHGFGWYDPAKGAGALLASSTATEKHCPFDGVPCQVHDILPDPKRQCLWLCVGGRPVELSGLWRYTPATGAFQRVVEDESFSAANTSSAAWNGVQILAHLNYSNLVLINPDTFAKQWIVGQSEYPLECVAGLPRFQARWFTGWPAYCEGEDVLMGGHGDPLSLCTPDHPVAAGKQISSIVSFHPSPQGIVAVSAYGKVWIIRKKGAQATADPAKKDQSQ